MIDVSIIIVNYNTNEFLKECIRSIDETISKDIKYEVIVVDNNSENKIKSSEFRIKNKNLEFTCIQNKENFGFSKANNIGVQKSQGRYVLFLNPDTVIHKNTLEEMIAFMDQNQKVGAATCKLVLGNGELDDASHRGFPTPWNSFAHFSGLSKLFPRSKLFSGYSLGSLDFNSIHEIDALAGAFMIVRRSAGEEVGWWDEDFFWYGEDLDFCYRLKQKGWKIFFVPTVSILHYKGISGGIKKHSQHLSNASKETKMRATQARFSAMKIFYRKHYKSKYPWIINQLVMKEIDIKLFFSKLTL